MSTYGYFKQDAMSDYAIAHHGIKGQKWGVRRFQNEDGSLTEAGKKRYLNSNGYLKPNAYSDTFIGKKGLFGPVDKIDTKKYDQYRNQQKAKEKEQKYLKVKKEIPDFDSKINKTIKQLIKDAKDNAEEYFDGSPLVGGNEVLDGIWDNFGFTNLTDEQYKTIYDKIEDELKNKGIGWYD